MIPPPPFGKPRDDRSIPPELHRGEHWFACLTRARAEKKVEFLLAHRGIRAYLPLVVRERQWADRRKRVEFPLFPGYLFVRIPFRDTTAVLWPAGVVRLADPNGYPTPVPDAELDSVRRLVAGINVTGLSPSPVDYLEPGEEVIVTSGPFEGMNGVLLEHRGRTRVAIRISALRQATSIELDRSILRPRNGKISEPRG